MKTPTITFFAAGVQFTGYAEIKHKIASNDKVYLEHDTLNPHDTNAIAIKWQDEQGELHRIGYVPRDNPDKGITCQGELFNWAALGGYNFTATVLNHFISNKPWQALQIAVTCEIPERKGGKVLFNI